MPFINLWTNLPELKLDNEFRRTFLATVANSMQKPVESTALIVQSGPNCCQIGSDPAEPAMILQIKSIGRVSAEENVIHCKNISEFVQSRLGISPDRVMIHFQSLEKHEVGKGGTTVEKMCQ
ncbi:hypothetical protein niasHT_015757 [Heterodera trifolii]|uniref:L-dopachrome isomerase n=1 Tax=Heterodera trifolii TaxID=157864 RepID=A0ABD2L6S6_9BILA